VLAGVHKQLRPRGLLLVVLREGFSPLWPAAGEALSAAMDGSRVQADVLAGLREAGYSAVDLQRASVTATLPARQYLAWLADRGLPSLANLTPSALADGVASLRAQLVPGAAVGGGSGSGDAAASTTSSGGGAGVADGDDVPVQVVDQLALITARK
jgi:hypothetical protein